MIEFNCIKNGLALRSFGKSPSRKDNKFAAGFTLVEILVAISIISVLSVFMVINFGDARKQYARERSIHKIHQDLRRAETLAMSSQEFNGESPLGGYGVYLNVSENDHYVLFADLNANQQYDAGSDGLVQDIKLENGITISGLSSSPLTITFLAPIPVVNIRPSAQSATVSLTGGDTVTINAAGLIEVNH